MREETDLTEAVQDYTTQSDGGNDVWNDEIHVKWPAGWLTRLFNAGSQLTNRNFMEHHCRSIHVTLGVSLLVGLMVLGLTCLVHCRGIFT